MGGILSCLRRPLTDEKQPHNNQRVHQEFSDKTLYGSSAADKKSGMNVNSAELNSRKVEWMTLEECFWASPNLNTHPYNCIVGSEVSMFKNLPKKVHPSSSPDDTGQEFLRPRRSFSAERLGIIDEMEDCIGASPNLNADPCDSIVGGEIQTFKNLRKKVNPSPSPDDSQEFFTPKLSFRGERSGQLEKFDKKEADSSRMNLPRRTGSGNSGKKVTFRLPVEADVFVYYSPKETFEES